MAWPVDDGIDAHIDAGQPLAVAHVRGPLLGVVAVGVGRGGRDRRAVARGEGAGTGGVVVTVRLVAQVHGVNAAVERGAASGAGARDGLGAAVGRIEVIPAKMFGRPRRAPGGPLRGMHS